MGFQDSTNEIRWRLHLASPPQAVHRTLATDAGRARFWAESAIERGGVIDFRFIDGSSLRVKVLESRPPHRFSLEYFGGSVATFDLKDDGRGGTDLDFVESSPDPTSKTEQIAGWVSVLLALKAAVDHGVDLRNHDPRRTWRQGFADN